MTMELDQLTVLIVTFNEKANIKRTLNSLCWARNILVVDSFSTDDTIEILENNSRVRVFQREFKDFADQCNFGLSKIETPWVLSIDADYVFPGNCQAIIEKAIKNGEGAFQTEFDYAIYGEPVRGSILPPRTVLYKAKGAHYVNDGHGHRVIVDEPPSMLSFNILHDDRKACRQDNQK